MLKGLPWPAGLHHAALPNYTQSKPNTSVSCSYVHVTAENCKMLAVKKHLFTTQPSRPSVTSYNKTISSLNLLSWGKVPSSGYNYLQRNRETESDWEEKNTKWFFRHVCVLPIIRDINISFKFTHEEKKTKMNQMSRYCHIKSLNMLLLKSYYVHGQLVINIITALWFYI